MSLWRSLFSALCVLLVVAAGCSATNPEQIGAAVPPSEPNAVEQVLRVAVVGLDRIEPEDITPASAELVFAVDLLHDSLTDFDRSTGAVRPGVASGWSSEDGVTWQFDIEEGRTFSDGAPITSEDVVASLSRAAGKDPESVVGSNLDVIEGVEEYRSGSAATVSGLATLGPGAVQVVAGSPNYELPALLANPALAIRPATVVANDDASAPTSPVGSGPFRLVGSGTGGFSFARIGAADGLDRVELMRVETIEEGAELLAQQSVDVARHVSGAEPPRGSALVSVPSGIAHLVFNTIDGTTSSIDARAAIAAGIDRQAMTDEIVGRSVPEVNSLVPGEWWVPDGCHVACSYDAAAAALAVGEVWPDGAPTVFIDADLSELSSVVVPVIALQLGAVGVPAEQRRGEPSDLSFQIAAGNHEAVFFASFSAVPSPDPTLWDSFASDGRSNLSGVPSNGTDEALRAARATPDDATRREAYRDVEQLAMSDVAVVPLVSVGALFDVSETVSGVDPMLGLLLDADAVSLSE